MTEILDEYRDVAEHLRTLASCAAAGTRANHNLASVVLAKRRVTRRRRVHRYAGGTVAGLVALGGVAGATLPDRGNYFAQGEPSSAMTPTVTQGEVMVTSKKLHPAHEDLVVYRLPSGHGLESISRVIGLPGDTVACAPGPDGQCTTVTVNGRPLAEPYTQGHGAPFATTVVPAGDLFLLGDSRDNAVDSRLFGFLGAGSVKGVGVRIIGLDGHQRSIPGAPLHPGPNGSDTTDPMAPPPPAVTSPL